MSEVDNASYTRGKRAVMSVLSREFAAHRSLWIGALLFAFFASLAYPYLSGAADIALTALRAFASAILFYALLFLWTLNLLFKSFGAYTATLKETEKEDFIRGLYSGLILPMTGTLLLIAFAAALILWL